MKLPSMPLLLRQAHKYHSEEVKRSARVCLVSWKELFAIVEFEPRISNIWVSDTPTPHSSHNLNIRYSNEFIHTKTWKDQLQAMTIQWLDNHLPLLKSRFDFPDRTDTHKLMQKAENVPQSLSAMIISKAAHMLPWYCISTVFLNSQFHWLPPTAFKFWFKCLDPHSTFNHRQRPKTFICANQSLRFWTAIEWNKSSIMNHDHDFFNVEG